MVRRHHNPKQGFEAAKLPKGSNADIARMSCTFTDPQALTLSRLEKELCSIGCLTVCRKCMTCAYGREYVKRMDAANAAQ